MKYLSVCSGIEAATVAWHHLGWKPSGFSEVEPFPSAVLSHHYPEVTNFGDMTQFKEWDLGNEAIDILVGGTPCQSFSVAGLRQGLKDPRGNLMLVYLAIAERFRPQWIVWENVPGVLSSNGGRDFGTFLGALVKLGYGFAYRVLDAQWFGVAQRRRRVFVVGHLGDWRRAAAVLFERESLRRHPAPSREAREGTAADVAGSIGQRISRSRTELDGHGAYVAHAIPNTAKCVTTGEAKRQDWETCTIIPAPVAIQGNLIGRDAGGPHGVGASDEGTMYTLTKADVHGVAHAVPYDLFQITAPVNRQNRKPGDPCHTLARDNAAHAAVAFSSNISVPDCQTDGTTPTVKCGGSDGGNPPAVAIGTDCYNGQLTGDIAATMAVRRLTPVECERLQGFPDGYTAIPWRGKPATECPDGPRYRALGNSMAVPVMRWIGERIQNLRKESA